MRWWYFHTGGGTGGAKWLNKLNYLAMPAVYYRGLRPTVCVGGGDRVHQTSKSQKLSNSV